MFAGFPKLFDRSFFIGYFLPSFLLLLGLGSNLLLFDYIDEKAVDEITKKDALNALIFLALVWLLSILLSTFSRSIIRLLEGYGAEANPFHIFLPWQKQLFKIRAEPHLRNVESVLEARRRGTPEPVEFDKTDVWLAALNFPEELNLVLPTRLGNVMRAYERYSDVVYGIEAIVLWPRLSMILPEQARERIREAESLFYFSINMLVVGIFTTLTSATMVIVTVYRKGSFEALDVIDWRVGIIVLISIFFILFSWLRLPDTASERGDQVKSTFDLYRKPLAEALGFELPATEAEERKMWELISRKMLLRVSDDRLRGYDKNLDYFRKKNDDSALSEDRSTAKDTKANGEGSSGEEVKHD
jgi:hypothetical protein